MTDSLEGGFSMYAQLLLESITKLSNQTEELKKQYAALDMGKYDGRCGKGGKLIEKKNCNKGGRCKKWEDQEMYIERKAAIPRKRW